MKDIAEELFQEYYNETCWNLSINTECANTARQVIRWMLTTGFVKFEELTKNS